jgi:DNA-binding CsgD family transcriptional regulator
LPGPLTDRQQQVLQLAAGGLHDWEMGDQLGLKAHTVRLHLMAARKKLGARNTTQAVAIALKCSLISVDLEA